MDQAFQFTIHPDPLESQMANVELINQILSSTQNVLEARKSYPVGRDGHWIHAREWRGFRDLIEFLNSPPTGEICVSSYKEDTAVFCGGMYVELWGEASHIFPCDVGSILHRQSGLRMIDPTIKLWDSEWYDEAWIIPSRCKIGRIWIPQNPIVFKHLFPYEFRYLNKEPTFVSDLP